MKKSFYCICLLTFFVMASCNNPPDQPAANEPDSSATASQTGAGTFGYDRHFLQQHDSIIVLTIGKASVIVSPKYQAKVFTSTAAGDSGMSFGWVNYKAFTGAPDAHMNAYGGENRLWLGPEGGKFSLFFAPGDSMIFDHWKTPAGFDTEAWKIVSKQIDAVSMEKDLQLTNYHGTQLDIRLRRSVQIMDARAIADRIGIAPAGPVAVVGYKTENILINQGKTAWTAESGMPCLWLLDMFKPTDQTTIVVPYSDGPGKPATTDYFGEIDSSRIHYNESVLLFRADGKSRGKLGVHPTRAKKMAGSYDALHHVLTVTLFDIEQGGNYLNQEWNTRKPPFSGDAVNAYNDGPLANGSQMGPFYELESVSPAAMLNPGASLVHVHSVFHFTGPESALDPIAIKVLGVSLERIKNTFR